LRTGTSGAIQRAADPAQMGEGETARPIHYVEQPGRSDRFEEARALSALAENRLARLQPSGPGNSAKA
jgi:hypothetical protein